MPSCCAWDDELLQEVTDEDTTASLWLKLESLYMEKSLQSAVLKEKALYSSNAGRKSH